MDLVRLREVVAGALALPSGEQTAYLIQACGDDAEMLAEAQSLVAAQNNFGDNLAGAIEQRLDDAYAHAVLEDQLPDAIGPYRILSMLGEGGMGLVYAAEQREPVRRRVAVKVIKLGMDTTEVLARFEQEHQALSVMNHPSIAQVFDAGATEDGRPYFVMEYVSGLPITEFCDRQRLSTDARLELFTQVCRAVQHAHQKGVIHRDIKPSNVLVTLQDSAPLPKIIDFGVAKATSARLTEKTLFTQHGQMVGTPEYMSPEQADLTGLDIDTRSDVYSLGVVLYELLAGTLPFDAATLRKAGYAEIQRIIREVDPEKPSTRIGAIAPNEPTLADHRATDLRSLQRKVRGDLDWIVMKMLAKDRRHRYDSAQAVADDLQRHRDLQPVSAGPPSSWYQLSRFVQRHQSAVLAGSVAALSLVLGLAAVSIVQTRANLQLEAHNARLTQLNSDVFSLSASQTLRELSNRAQHLWPAIPQRIPEYEAWLVDAQALVAELPAHKRRLDALAARTGALSTSEQWWYAQLQRLVAELTAFADEEHGFISGTSVLDADGIGLGVRKRLALAQHVATRSISGDNAQKLWDQALQAIAANDGPYDMAMSPQLGLLPLGPDPDSGLWEFVHVQTGTIPQRKGDGQLAIDESSGVVFVLIPAGTFAMGAQRTDPTAANYDVHALDEEAPVHTVTLDAFFLAKYEVTQGQWARLFGSRPSLYGTDRVYADKQHSDLNPVERVRWEQARDNLRQFGLQLPTEAQWEYAARGGTQTVWWMGNEKAELQGVANLVDRFLQTNGGPVTWDYETWLDDGWAVHAPVGTYAANPFGLHDMQGNVWEWCRDLFDEKAYTLSPRAGDGLHEVVHSEQYTVRGGSFDANYHVTRSAHRGYHASGKLEYVGVRAMRRVEP